MCPGEGRVKWMLDAGFGIFQEALGEQRLAQLGDKAVLPGHIRGVKDLGLWI